VLRGKVDFTGGDYDVIGKSGDTPDVMFSKDNGPWHLMDKTVHSSCSHPSHYRFAAFPIAHAPMHVVISAKMTEAQKSCQPCSDLPQQSQCLVGTGLVDNGMVETLYSTAMWDNIKAKSTKVTGTATIEFKKDGTATINNPTYQLSGDLKNQPASIKVTAHGIEDGHWSSNNNLVRICPAHSNVKIDTETTIKMAGQTMVSKVTVNGGMEKMELEFECNGPNLMITSTTAKLRGTNVFWKAHKIK
jgi:hypothetical protein